MPTGLVKPDGWLREHGLWEKYTREWHDQEVRRHANAMRDANSRGESEIAVVVVVVGLSRGRVVNLMRGRVIQESGNRIEFEGATKLDAS